MRVQVGRGGMNLSAGSVICESIGGDKHLLKSREAYPGSIAKYALSGTARMRVCCACETASCEL